MKNNNKDLSMNLKKKPEGIRNELLQRIITKTN